MSVYHRCLCVGLTPSYECASVVRVPLFFSPCTTVMCVLLQFVYHCCKSVYHSCLCIIVLYTSAISTIVVSVPSFRTFHVRCVPLCHCYLCTVFLYHCFVDTTNVYMHHCPLCTSLLSVYHCVSCVHIVYYCCLCSTVLYVKRCLFTAGFCTPLFRTYHGVYVSFRGCAPLLSVYTVFRAYHIVYYCCLCSTVLYVKRSLCIAVFCIPFFCASHT